MDCRTLHFPATSVGWLYTRYPSPAPEPGGRRLWQLIGDARGSVAVPLNAEVRLRVDPRTVDDLSWLASLPPDSFYELDVKGVRLGRADYATIAAHYGLRSLNLAETPTDDERLLTLQPLRSLHELSLRN